MSAGGITPLLPLIAPFYQAWEVIKKGCQSLLNNLLGTESSNKSTLNFSQSRHGLFYPSSFSRTELSDTDSNDVELGSNSPKWMSANN